MVTFGLDSYIIPITPSGTETRDISKPFGLFHLDISTPRGSSILAICFKPLIISCILLSFSKSLSRKASDTFFSFAFSKSILLASNIANLFFSINFAVFNMAKFLFLASLTDIILKASFDF